MLHHQCLFVCIEQQFLLNVAAAVGLALEQVERVITDIHAKRRANLPLHLLPL
jgi:hypothetical protein